MDFKKARHHLDLLGYTVRPAIWAVDGDTHEAYKDQKEKYRLYNSGRAMIVPIYEEGNLISLIKVEKGSPMVAADIAQIYYILTGKSTRE